MVQAAPQHYVIDVSVLSVTERGSLSSEHQTRVDDALGQLNPRTETLQAEITFFQDEMRLLVDSFIAGHRCIFGWFVWPSN